MKVIELVKILGLEVFAGADKLEIEATTGYVSDLLSDVMGNASQGAVWITLQTHPNIVAVASLKEISAVILVKGLRPADETIIRANEENIPVLGTSLPAFELTGKIFNLLVFQK